MRIADIKVQANAMAGTKDQDGDTIVPDNYIGFILALDALGFDLGLRIKDIATGEWYLSAPAGCKFGETHHITVSSNFCENII